MESTTLLTLTPSPTSPYSRTPSPPQLDSLCPPALLAYPLRIHQAWATVTAILNYNTVLVAYNSTHPSDLSQSTHPSDLSQSTHPWEIFATWASVWLVAGVGSYRALFQCDGVFPAVLAWSFAWMSSKIRHNPPSRVQDRVLQDALETTFDVLRCVRGA